MRHAAVFALVLLTAATAAGQESRFAADLRREGEDIQKSCTSGIAPTELVGCVVTLATDDPLHVAAGSLAPQNGMGFGIAFVEHYTPNERWRISWNADTVFATSGGWRAGGYMKLVYRPASPIVVVRPGASSPQTPRVPIVEYPVINVYAQGISLPSLTVSSGTQPFSETQTIAGANAIYPVVKAGALHVALLGELNGRWLTVRDTSLGEETHPAFAQFGGGVRARPSFGARLRLNYLATIQQFTSADEGSSFHRWTLDLQHEVPLYSIGPSRLPKDVNGPDECFESLGSGGCPPVSYSRNREGAIGFRLLAMRSIASDDGAVPFYFQPTLGGSDINGQRLLAAFDDYRFRGPNLIALQETIEHSIWGPIGAYALFEQGKVTQAGEPLGFDGLARSYAVGVTIRAGGFPLVNVTFAWGADGHRVIGSMDSTLLGGSARPSLY
jgi:hypothetical protein